MANVVLNTRLSGQDTTGYFVFLGYSTTSQVAANSESSNCHGLFNESNVASSPIGDVNNSDSSPSILEYIGSNVNNPYGTDNNTVPIAQGTVFGYSNTVDFTGKDVGFYGFMYIVGDNNPNDGVLSGDECGDVVCFEIEVVDGITDIPDAAVSYCTNNIPATIDLGALLASADYDINNGTWSGTGLGTLSGDIITVGTPGQGTYTYTFTQTTGSITSVHSIDGNCPTCQTQTTDVTIQVTNASSAGTATSLAVCN